MYSPRILLLETFFLFNLYVSVRFQSLAQNTWDTQFKREKMYFGSRFQRLQLMVSWLQSRNITWQRRGERVEVESVREREKEGSGQEHTFPDHTSVKFPCCYFLLNISSIYLVLFISFKFMYPKIQINWDNTYIV